MVKLTTAKGDIIEVDVDLSKEDVVVVWGSRVFILQDEQYIETVPKEIPVSSIVR